MHPNYRRCVSCRKVDHKSAFWRVVRVFPSQEVQLDQGMGRSAYLCPSQDCLQLAQKKDRIGRSLRVAVPTALYQTLGQRLSPSKQSSSAEQRGKN
ncbi:MAG: YlxR family protein [Elainella sp. Prado103]|nr:YlxR family protein [Elainella sp. Prado103]